MQVLSRSYYYALFPGFVFLLFRVLEPLFNLLLLTLFQFHVSLCKIFSVWLLPECSYTFRLFCVEINVHELTSDFDSSLLWSTWILPILWAVWDEIVVLESVSPNNADLNAASRYDNFLLNYSFQLLVSWTLVYDLHISLDHASRQMQNGSIWVGEFLADIYSKEVSVPCELCDCQVCLHS